MAGSKRNILPGTQPIGGAAATVRRRARRRVSTRTTASRQQLGMGRTQGGAIDFNALTEDLRAFNWTPNTKNAAQQLARLSQHYLSGV